MHARRAFTLVELLVVISIIGILMSIIIPAVQMAKEAARQSECKNNVKQLSTAMATYEAQTQRLPCNWGDPLASNIGGASWITMILPFCEASATYSQIDMTQPISYVDAASGVNNLLAARTDQVLLKCPSDTYRGDFAPLVKGQVLAPATSVAVTAYKGCGGSNWEYTEYRNRKADARPDPNVDQGFGGKNATQYDGLVYPDGMLGANRGSTAPKHLRTMEIQDGLSNTFAIGEACPMYSNWSAWYHPESCSATCAMPPNYVPEGKRRGTYRDVQEENYSFSSKHPGLVIMGLHGGSVTKVSDDIDIRVWRALSTIDGRETTFEDSGTGEIVQVQMP